MSRLRVFRPEALGAGERLLRVYEPEPQVLSFETFAARKQARRVFSLVARARALHNNKRCPYCRHPIVEPVELDDAVVNRNRMTIPGTATLVGFHCERCSAEWPVEN